MIKRTIFLLAFTALTPLGCGGGGDQPELGTVTGIVTIDGTPTEGVLVTFNPAAGGRRSTGKSNADGKYELVYNSDSMGAVIGEHNVSISAVPNLDPEDPAATMNPGSTVPKEYVDVTKVVTVEPGSNEIDLTYP